MFFSFDGLDGVGKTTQMQLFESWLAELGHATVTCRDPGSTPLGEQLRDIVLHSPESVSIGARSEMLLYMAARAQLVDEVILPAIAAQKVVISDRFLLANIVYQGYAGGIDIAKVREVGLFATNDLLPDCVFLLDMPPRDARNRLGADLDRMEQRGDEFRLRLREGFLAEAACQGPAVHVIDAQQSIEQVHQQICEIAIEVLKR